MDASEPMDMQENDDTVAAAELGKPRGTQENDDRVAEAAAAAAAEVGEPRAIQASEDTLAAAAAMDRVVDMGAEGMGTAWAMGFKGCVLDEHKLVIAWDSEFLLSSE